MCLLKFKSGISAQIRPKSKVKDRELLRHLESSWPTLLYTIEGTPHDLHPSIGSQSELTVRLSGVMAKASIFY